MAPSSRPLTADSTVGTWLDDPIGGVLVREMLAQSGHDAKILGPVRRFSLRRLQKLTRGQLTDAVIDDLVRRAAAGGDAAPTSAAPTSTALDREPTPVRGADVPGDAEPEWEEVVLDGRFTGRTVVVTGAGSGIGRATASRIAREGGRVIAVDLFAERLEELRSDLGTADVTCVTCDITAPDAPGLIVSAAGPRIDGLANVAGLMDDMTPVHEVSDELWQRLFAVNVEATMRLMRAVLPSMLERRAGSVVNVASEAGLRGSAAGAAYTASKHAVVGLTKNSAFMYGPTGVRVNVVAPGPTITNIRASFGSELGRERMEVGMSIAPGAVESEAVAASICYLLSDDAVNLTGVVLPSDGGWSAA